MKKIAGFYKALGDEVRGEDAELIQCYAEPQHGFNRY